jgi:hypothetical protein
MSSPTNETAMPTSSTPPQTSVRTVADDCLHAETSHRTQGIPLTFRVGVSNSTVLVAAGLATHARPSFSGYAATVPHDRGEERDASAVSACEDVVRRPGPV